MGSSTGASSVRDRLAALVDWERRDRGASMRVDTEPVADLLARSGAPQRSFRPIHLAGSKGKGSVAAWIDAGLRRAGLSTGRYTSPHLETLEERACIDGRPCAPRALDQALERSLDALEAARAAGTAARDATWFDVLTASAFGVFADAGVERQVIECGLGGRLDSTNVLRAPLVVITTIELEHTEVLGSTREAIAAEKAGIIWPGARVAVGLPAPGSGDPAADVIAERVRAVGARARFLPPRAGDGLEARNRRLAAALFDLAGEAGEAGVSGQPLSGALLEGLDPAEARLPGRLERFDVEGAEVVLDGAHTADSVALVRAELAGEAGPPPVVIAALSRDKDAARVLKPLVGWVDTLICTASDPVRHQPAQTLRAAASGLGLASVTHNTPEAALDTALAAASGGRVLALGSLLLAGCLRPLIRRRSSAGPRC